MKESPCPGRLPVGTIRVPDPSEIHIWHLPLAGPRKELEAACHCLDDAECRRASQYRHAMARAAFIQTRCCLRQLLGHYLKQAPSKIRFMAGPYGKPCLDGLAPESGLVFNVSHTTGQAILGFAVDTALGLDLEVVNPHRNLAALARFCLAPGELEHWQATAPAQQPCEFMRLWVCKEAFVKAVGRGIALGVSEVVLARDYTGFQSVPQGCREASDWCMHEWEAGGCRAAVVYAGAPRKIRICA